MLPVAAGGGGRSPIRAGAPPLPASTPAKSPRAAATAGPAAGGELPHAVGSAGVGIAGKPSAIATSCSSSPRGAVEGRGPPTAAAPDPAPAPATPAGASPTSAGGGAPAAGLAAPPPAGSTPAPTVISEDLASLAYTNTEMGLSLLSRGSPAVGGSASLAVGAAGGGGNTRLRSSSISIGGVSDGTRGIGGTVPQPSSSRVVTPASAVGAAASWRLTSEQTATPPRMPAPTNSDQASQPVSPQDSSATSFPTMLPNHLARSPTSGVIGHGRSPRGRTQDLLQAALLEASASMVGAGSSSSSFT